METMDQSGVHQPDANAAIGTPVAMSEIYAAGIAAQPGHMMRSAAKLRQFESVVPICEFRLGASQSNKFGGRKDVGPTRSRNQVGLEPSVVIMCLDENLHEEAPCAVGILRPEVLRIDLVSVPPAP